MFIMHPNICFNFVYDLEQILNEITKQKLEL